MNLRNLVLVIAVLVVCGGCKKNQQQTNAPETPNPQSLSSTSGNVVSLPTVGSAKTDACSLLTSAEIEAVQQEPVKQTKLSGTTEGGFTVSQCFFTLTTFTNSISLQITQRGEGAHAREPREFWSATFHREEKSETEHEREKEGREEEEESAPALKIQGVGDEAFWMGSRVGGALYVLRGNNYVRLSVGGAGDQEDKIKKSRILAERVIARL